MTKIVAMPPLCTCTHVQKMNIQYLLWEFAFFGLFYTERHTLVSDYVGVTFKNNLAKRELFFCNIPTWTVQLLMLYSISTCTINNAVMSEFATNYFKIQWRIQFLQWYIKLFMHYICSLNINKINDHCLWTWRFGINSQNYYSFLKEILIFKYIESR